MDLKEKKNTKKDWLDKWKRQKKKNVVTREKEKT